MDIAVLLTMNITAFVTVLIVLEMLLAQLSDGRGLFGDVWYHKVLSLVAVILLIILELNIASMMLDLFNQL